MKLESEIQKEVISMMRTLGFKVWKNYLSALIIHGGKRVKNPNSGLPDLFGLSKKKPGRLVAIELKSRDGKLSEDQRKEIKELEEFGVYVVVARNINHVREEIERFENGR